MVMATPSKVMIGVANDRTTKGVRGVQGTGNEGKAGQGRLVVVARL